jgi:hypothetical protein
MKINVTLLEHLQIVREISSLPDDATVSAELAALFLGTSPKSLGRLRQSKDGDGPPYTQYPQAGSKARNQPVNYIMRNLREWRNKHIVTSTMDAAIRRGMAFSRVNDLVIPQPFWSSEGEIINHAFCLTIEEFTTLLTDPNATLVWIKWSAALSQNWKNNAIREPFHSAYLSLLSGLIKAAEQNH